MAGPRPPAAFIGNCLATLGKTVTFELPEEYVDPPYFHVGIEYAVHATPQRIHHHGDDDADSGKDSST